MNQHKGKVVVVSTTRGEDLIGKCTDVRDHGYTLKDIRLIGMIPQGHEQAGSLLLLPYMPFCGTMKPGSETVIYSTSIQSVMYPLSEVTKEYENMVSPVIQPDKTIVTG